MEQKYKIMLKFKNIVDTFKAQSGDNVNKETMIEEGNYYIKANEVIEANIINNVNIDINQFNLGNKYIKLHKNTSDKNIADKNTSNNNTANKNTSNNKTSNKETNNNKTIKDNSLLTKALNLVKIQSTAYTIHGGKSYGDNKGIDLATQDLAFFKALQKLTNKYKVELENANNVIRVEVGYESYYIDDEGYLQGLSIVKYPIANLTKNTSNFSKNPIAIVLHRTASHTAKSTLVTWKNERPYGTHFLIDKDGTIYQCASLHKWTRHVGDIKAKDLEINGKNSADYNKYKNKTYSQASKLEQTNKQYPNRYPINKEAIGIEVVGNYLGDDAKLSRYDSILKYTQFSGDWEKATQKQKDSTKQLADILKDIYNMTDDDIYIHGHISGHKKQSEGESIL